MHSGRILAIYTVQRFGVFGKRTESFMSALTKPEKIVITPQDLPCGGNVTTRVEENATTLLACPVMPFVLLNLTEMCFL